MPANGRCPLLTTSFSGMPRVDEGRIMISALEHYAYCPRQCALIHVEQTYEENVFTLRGNRAHERVDDPAREERSGIRVERALPLYSDRLGLVGRADVVEFHGETPYPIEYKQGRKRHHHPARIQLAAQAMCLEEMTGRPVPKGALFHTSAHRRQEVEITERLRTAVEDLVRNVRVMLEAGHVPPPVNDDRCPPCSLATTCMPAAIDHRHRQRWWAGALFRTSDP